MPSAPLKSAFNSLYTYEGNEPHSLIHVHMDRRGDSLICSKCEAYVCDHNAVSPEDMPIGDLKWEAVTTYKLPFGRLASGCDFTPEVVDPNFMTFNAIEVLPEV